MQPASPCALGLDDLHFSTADAAADVARRPVGQEVIADVMEIGTSGKMAICADPTGAVFGLWEAWQARRRRAWRTSTACPGTKSPRAT